MYIDRYGRSVELRDRTKFPYNLIDSYKSLVSKLKYKLRANDYKGTGTYVSRNGRWVLVSRSAGVPDLWWNKWKMDGDKDRQECYRHMEERCTLHKIDHMV